MNAYVILGIETSCDDTSMAIVKDGKVLSVFSISSLKKFHKYGGIVPEIAARMHEEALFEVLEKNILEAKIKINDFTHIAYTSCPGMPGSLHVGKIFAKTLSFLFNIPLLPINHMLGHIFSFAINNKKIIKYPFISLVVSGGDTVIYKISNVDKYKILNATTDDSVGETLDKIGRVLSLEYPGGVSIDKNYNKKYANLKLIDHYPCEKNFSFSGIKTFILNMVNNLKLKKKLVDHIQIGSSVLKWMVEELLIKTNYYINKNKIKMLAIGGGVSANKLLREEINKLNYQTYIPEIKFSGDNGAMIAFYAYLLLMKK